MVCGPQQKQFCSGYYVWFCRIWGIATALVLWGIGIEVAYDSEIVGYYIVIVAAVMSALESLFLVHHLVRECQGDCSKTCLSCWSCTIQLDDWRKSILYIAFSVFCLVHQFVMHGEAWLSVIAGTMLLLAAAFYFIKSFTNSRLYMPAEVSHQRSMENSYSRVDRTGEELGSGGSITNELPANLGDSGSIQSGAPLLDNIQGQSMAEQVEIMEA